MERYITLGADENGEVYGLKLDEDGRWERNSLGFPTSCAVIRPVMKENYEYLTEDPQSVKELWQQAVQADQTEKGLDDWFKEIDTDELIDKSFVYELLEDENNPTIVKYRRSREFVASFREWLQWGLVNSGKVSGIESEDDVYEWEGSGWFPPRRPFCSGTRAEGASRGVLRASARDKQGVRRMNEYLNEMINYMLGNSQTVKVRG